MTEAPLSITYSSVVSRDSVRLPLLHAAINGLDLMACDVGNAYLHAPCKEKVWFLGGAEAGEDKGKILVIIRALYGLKSSGASWRSMLSQSLRDMGFENSIADPDVWRRSATTETGKEYYELLLVYVDDIPLSTPTPTMSLNILSTPWIPNRANMTMASTTKELSRILWMVSLPLRYTLLAKSGNVAMEQRRRQSASLFRLLVPAFVVWLCPLILKMTKPRPSL
jgi:hypothetical protein